MKVKELIEILQKYDGEMEVLLDPGHDEFSLQEVYQEAMFVQEVSYSKHNEFDIKKTATIPMFYRKEYNDPVKCLLI